MLTAGARGRWDVFAGPGEAALRCVGVLGIEAVGSCVGLPRTAGTGNVWMFQGGWTCWHCQAFGVVGVLGQQTWRCGCAGQLAVSGRPIRGWQGGKGITVWESCAMQLVRQGAGETPC